MEGAVTEKWFVGGWIEGNSMSMQWIKLFIFKLWLQSLALDEVDRRLASLVCGVCLLVCR